MVLAPLDYIRNSVELHLESKLSSDDLTTEEISKFLGGGDDFPSIFVYLPAGVASDEAPQAQASCTALSPSNHGSMVVINNTVPKAVTSSHQLQIMMLTPCSLAESLVASGGSAGGATDGQDDDMESQIKLATTASLALYTRHAYGSVIQSLYTDSNLVLDNVQTKIRDLELTLNQLKRRKGSNIPIVSLKAHGDITAACLELDKEKINSFTVDDLARLPLSDDNWLNEVQDTIKVWIGQVNKITGLVERTPFPDTSLDTNADLEEISFWTNLESALQTVQSIEMNKAEVRATIMVLKSTKRFLATIALENNTNLESALAHVQDVCLFLKPLPVDKIVTSQTFANLSEAVDLVYGHLPKIRFSKNYGLERLAQLIEAVSLTFASKLSDIYKVRACSLSMNYNTFLTAHEEANEVIEKFDEGWSKFIELFTDLCRRRKLDRTPQSIIEGMDLSVYKALRDRIMEVYNFRHNHELLRRHVMHSHPTLVSEVESAVTAFNGVSLVNTESMEWGTACESYDTRIHSIETKLASVLSAKLSGCRDAEEMFSVFKQFTNLLAREPIRQSVKQYQTTLMENTNIALNTLQQKFTDRTSASNSQNLVMALIPPVTARLLWAKLMEREVTRLQENLAALLGPDWARDIHGSKFASRCQELLAKLDGRGYLRQWVSKQEKYLTGSLIRRSYIIDVKRDSVGYYAVVNFIAETANLSSEIHMLSRLGYHRDIPRTLSHFAKETKQQYPYASAIGTALRTYATIVRQLDPASAKLVEPQLSAIAEVIKLAFGNKRVKWDSKGLADWVGQLVSLVEQLEGRVYNLLVLRCKLDEELRALSQAKGDVNLGEVVDAVQKIVDDLSLAGYTNLSDYCTTLDQRMEAILITKVEEALDYFEAACDAKKEIKVNVVIHDGIITVEPSMSSVREQFIALLHRHISDITDLKRIQSGRYELFATESTNSKPKTFSELLRFAKPASIVQCYQYIERRIKAATHFVRQWMTYQALWDTDMETLTTKLAGDLGVWKNTLVELKDARGLLDGGAGDGVFGPIEVAYLQIQSQITLKYDSWWHDIIRELTQILADAVLAQQKTLTEAKNNLEEIHLHPSTKTSDLLRGVTFLRNLDHNLEKWGVCVSEMEQSEKLVKRYNRHMPKTWHETSLLSTTSSQLSQALGKRQLYVQENVSVLQGRVKSAGEDLEKKVDEVLEKWDSDKPLSGKVMPAAALDTLTLYKKLLEGLSAEVSDLDQALVVLELTSSSAKSVPLAGALEDLTSLYEVWTHISTPHNILTSLLSASFIGCNLRKLRGELDRLLQECRALPARVRQYEGYNALHDRVTSSVSAYSSLSELQSPAVQPRHWVDISKMLNISEINHEKITVGTLLEKGLMVRKGDVQQVVARAQGEMALEVFLTEIKTTWSESFNMVLYQNRIRLIKGWDELYTAVDDHLTQLALVPGSPYYSTSPSIPPQHNTWTNNLTSLRAVFDNLIEVQRRWVYLESIFGAGGGSDVKGSLPAEWSRFQGVDKEFVQLMRKVASKKSIVEVLAVEGLVKSLERMCHTCTTIQKHLAQYLQTQRQQFCRFYFLGDDDLLDIIGGGSGIGKVASHLGKMFAGVVGVEGQDLVGADPKIESLVSKEGEIVPLSKPVSLKENVISWLTKLEGGMHTTLANLLHSAMSDDRTGTEDGVVAWTDRYPAQVVLLGMLVQWCMAVDDSLTPDTPGETKSDSRDELNSVLASLERKLSIMAKTVLSNNVAPNMRKKYEQVITELVHQRDVTRSLIEQGVFDKNDFAWLYHLRFRFDSSLIGTDGASVGDALSVHLSHAQFPYGYEYQGISERLVQTPLTDRCYLTLTQALHFRLGGSPFGPAGTGKTESVKALGATMGRFVVVMNCDETFDFGAMGRLFCGLCQVGAWGCFDEFNRLEERILSAVSSQILAIQQGLLQRQKSIEILGKQISLHSGVGIFVTMNPGYAGRSNLPDNLKTLFRSVAMVVPDRKLIAQVMLFSQGIVSAEKFSGSVVDLFILCQQRMSKQRHYDFGLRALKTLLVSAGALKRQALTELTASGAEVEGSVLEKVEKNVLIEGACQNVLPKLVASDLEVFSDILTEVFPGSKVAEMEDEALRDLLLDVCKEQHLVAGENWIQKILQLKQVLEMRHGVMLVGPVGTGKSTALKCLMLALERLDGIKGDIYIIDAKAMDKDALYGTLDGTTMEWQDGVFTSLLRIVVEGARGEKDRRHWIVFDGDVDPEWAENLNSVLDDNKLLTLPSGERINIPPNIRIIIEVDSLEEATPATVSRCGMVWFSEDVMSTEMCLENLMSGLLFKDINGGQAVSDGQLQFAQSIKSLVQYDVNGRASLVSEAIDFALQQEHIMDQSRPQLLTPLVSLLHKGIELAMEYNETHPDFPMSDDHMEKFSQRWLLFSLLWSFGGSAKWSVRFSLGDMLCTLAAIELPDSESNLIDYRVRLNDGEFEHWAASVPRSEIESHKVTSTDVVITTTDTVRHAEVLGAWLNSRKPLILCGPPGSGKTMTLTNVLQSLQGITLASLNFSSGTTPEIILKTFSQYCSYVRRGKSIVLEPMETFGADTWLVVFCDEINLPKKDSYGTQRVIMFMRQLVEQGGFWREDNIWVKINRIQFVGACNPPTDAGREEMSSRWLRHAPLLLVDFPARESLMQIYSTFNGGIMKLFPNLKGQTDALTEAMVELYTANQTKFTPDIQPQYFFSPRELSRWVRGIYEAVHDLDVLSQEELVRVWAHEALRLFCDRLVTEEERQWCEDKVDEVARQFFAGVDHEVALERPLFYSSWLTKDTRRINRDELKTFLAARLRVFYEEELDVPLVVFDEVLEHVLRIDRVLRQPMGHCLLVGDSGVGKTVLSKFVSWMNGLSIFQIKAHSRYGLHEFNEDLRSVMKRVGVEGEKVCFVFDEANALDSGFLEAMNALLASGEVPGLFEEDDYAALMSACRDSASRDGLIIDQEEELWRRFTSLVQRNLHVVFTMNPSGGDWKNRSTASPALFNRCVVDWFGTWGSKAKGEVGKEFTMRLDIGDAESVGGAWGIGEGDELMQRVEAAFDQAGSGGFRQAVVAALVDIHETTKKVAEESATEASRTFLSPRDYLALIQNFVTCVNERRSKVEDEQLHINAGLEKLKQTQDNVADLKLGLGKKTVELREKESLANAKLQQMVADQNVAEKRKEEAERMGKQVDEQQVVISKRKEEAQRDLDEAEPALVAAQTSVKSIKKRDLDEVRNLARPPDKVRLTLECVAIMMGAKTEWPEIRKMLSKSDFIPNIINFDANRLSERQIKAVESQYTIGNDELNVESVMRSSKACGPLYKWAESQIKFSSVYNRVQPLRKEVELLETEARKAKQENDRIDAEVAELENKISQYKTDYATLIRDVEVLKETMETVKTKVSRAESLLNSLSQESERWEKSSSGFKHILQSIIGDGLLLASFLTYFGYFDFKTRIGLMQKWRNTLDVIGINYRDELSMVESLSKASDRIEWQEEGLPSDSLSMENGVILDHCVRFPLIIDPSGQAIEYVQNKYKDKKIQKTSFLDKAFMKTLASAVRFGTTLLVENVESIDPVLNPILNREIQKTGGRALVRIGSEEVDYSPSFSIILSTKNPAAKLTPDLCSRVTLVNFTVTPASLQSQSLSLILRREKPEIERQRIEVLKLQGEQNVKLRSLEDQMLVKISAVEGSILDDDRVVEGMELLMKEGAQVEDQMAKSAVVMAEVEAAISKFNSLSVACRQIFVLLAAMRDVHFLYEFSSDSFMTVLESVLDETKRVEGETENARLENLTTNLFRETVARMCRGLLAEDKVVFVLLLGHIFKEGKTYSFSVDASVENLTELIYDRFGSTFKWQGRGLDALKAVTESEIKATVPILLCSAPGHDVSGRVEHMSKVAGRECTSLAMGSEEGFKSAEKLVSIASKTGKWVLLKNCHLCTEWLSILVKKLQAQNPHKDFRIFITSEISPKLPTGLLRMSDTIVAEAQTGIRATLSRFFCNISTDRFGQPEKNRIYLLLGWVHAVIQERLRFVPIGWSESYGFTESDASHALDSIDALIGGASGGKSHVAPEDIPWEAIRVTLSKSIFGGRISKPADQDALDLLLNALFVSESFDVGFKLVQTEETGTVPTLPEKTSKDECFSWIESLPPYNPPTWIGLDSSAEEIRSRLMAKSIIEKVNCLLVSEKDA